MPPKRSLGWHFGDAGLPGTNLELHWDSPGAIFRSFSVPKEALELKIYQFKFNLRLQGSLGRRTLKGFDGSVKKQTNL